MNAGINLVRFLLAFNVTAFHLWNSLARGAGPVAVMGFFYISGYVTTQTTQEVYAGARRSGAFLLNRFLRIYPQYFAAVLLSLAALAAFPEAADHINDYISWPDGWKEWIPQFAIFGLYGSDVRLLPATWVLATELYFYLLIGLVTGHSRGATVALALVSVPVGVLCALHVLPFDFYGHPVGNAFVFAFGSLTYFYRDSVRVGRATLAVACVAYLLHTYAIPLLEDSDLDLANISASLASFSPIVVYLLQNDFSTEWIASLSNVLGRLSYPVFLTHWTVCVLVSGLFLQGRASFDEKSLLGGGVYFLAMFAAVMSCALVFYWLIDKPVESLRRRIRERSSLAPGG
ncbi:MAG TPA: acyltransferase [Burkholderiales bacterium]|nr:acyltransferase [Burkholderiales bacterium]